MFLRLTVYVLASLSLSCEPSGTSSGPGPGSSCCKVCSAKSQACGDSCIALSKTCKAGYGCACDRNFEGESSSGDDFED